MTDIMKKNLMKIFGLFLILAMNSLYAEEFKLSCVKNYLSLVKPVDKVLVHPDIDGSPSIDFLKKPKEYRGKLTSSCQNELGANGDLRIIVDDQILISLEIFIQSKKQPKLIQFVKTEELPVIETGLHEWGMTFYNFNFIDKGKELPFIYEIIAITPDGYHERINYFSEETSQYQ